LSEKKSKPRAEFWGRVGELPHWKGHSLGERPATSGTRKKRGQQGSFVKPRGKLKTGNRGEKKKGEDTNS